MTTENAFNALHGVQASRAILGLIHKNSIHCVSWRVNEK
jgi:hypothetical protein